MDEYTITEAAELLQLDRVTVWRYIDSGQIKARRVGLGARAPWKISRDELERVAKILKLRIELKQ